jgi:hypothetical protein
MKPHHAIATGLAADRIARDVKGVWPVCDEIAARP